ncbi:uncharacterized protein FIBRA_04846 [Fibroporia radiculosa]|uniref:Uncharacterized protein n=1 Tax=Fibroporia radiculosa TaxID=599839 RepID=J4H366_9APHY|nr:uncharacterized protein FIBRA_04846 [Fibroporia radiculosa]CCM02739.1 predicted protein [Fibroporia radiculosa]
MALPGRQRTDGSRVVVVGAGIGGVSFAIALKRQLGFQGFTIYEQATDIGGTWRDNTYPGSGCDTPAHWYSLSTDLNPYWSTTVPPQHEVWAYWKALATKYDLYEHTTFHTKVISAAWDTAQQNYCIVLEDVKTGERRDTRASVVISAQGYLVERRIPENLRDAGLERFAGPVFHSANWNHDIPLSGKRVVVIGNGASAAQFIPRLIADQSTYVVNFCRTANWFLPSIRGDYSTLQIWAFANVPFVLRLYRNWLVLVNGLFPIMRRKWRAVFGGRAPEQHLIDYIQQTAPRKYHDQLVPRYPLGCRRPILDPGYLACLHQSNVELNWNGISRITENEIHTDKGETIAADVIILSTGFVTDQYSVHITGSDGQTLSDYFAANGGPTAYLGVGVPGFPNLFFVGGPNTVTSNGSAVFTHEIAINQIVQLLRPVLSPSPSILSVAPKRAAHDAYNKRLQETLSATSWVRCASWYRAGADGNGKNFGIFPWSVWAFWWLTRRVDWENWECLSV